MAGRDPEATKARLLAAALREFSAKGIAGARVDAIVERAATNKRMLYHYFGSKEGLFRQILRSRLVKGAAALGDVDAPRSHELSRLQDHYLANPDYVRLLMWEALEMDPGRPVEEEAGRRELYGRLIAGIEADQAAGVIPADLDASQLLLSQMALAMFPVAFPQLTRLVTGADVADAGFVERRRRFLGALGARLGSGAAAPRR